MEHLGILIHQPQSHKCPLQNHHIIVSACEDCGAELVELAFARFSCSALARLILRHVGKTRIQSRPPHGSRNNVTNVTNVKM